MCTKGLEYKAGSNLNHKFVAMHSLVMRSPHVTYSCLSSILNVLLQCTISTRSSISTCTEPQIWVSIIKIWAFFVYKLITLASMSKNSLYKCVYLINKIALSFTSSNRLTATGTYNCKAHIDVYMYIVMKS